MSFVLAHLVGARTAPVREFALAASSAGYRGALMLRDEAGAWAECAADPAAVGGVAESDFGTDTGGYGGHGTKEFPPGYMQCTLVADEVAFSAEYVGTLPAADGGSYGVVRSADGKWRVDFAEVTALVVKLTGRYTNSPENRNRVKVVFLPAATQIVGA